MAVAHRDPLHARLTALVTCGVALMTCASEAGPPAAPAAVAVEEVAFEGGLQGGWRDHGWAPRDLDDGKPASLDLSEYGGWVVGNDRIDGNFTALILRLKAPVSFGEFMQVSLLSPEGERLRSIDVDTAGARQGKDGFAELKVPMAQLNPDGKPFARVELRAKKRVARDRVLVQKVALLRTPGSAPSSVQLAVAERGAPGPGGRARAAPMQVDCSKPATKISPLIYGIAYDPRLDSESPWVWELKPSGRRFGGNPASRFSWRANAWNTASDWFFKNVNYTSDPAWTWRKFLAANASHDAATALTVPMLGWVAKDTTSASYPKSAHAAQQYFDGEAGNGIGPDGAKLKTQPSSTSIPAGADFVAEWVAQIPKGAVSMYILDNEPALWHDTHRDVHPEPAGYDEILQKSIATAAAIKGVDKDAIVAGPAEWGWPAYFFSAKDAAAGFDKKPDRLAHDDVPFLEWYLMKMKAEEERRGKRLLDVLTVHFYPQGQGVYGNEKADDATNALRVRSTRGLWDDDYVDESWIKDRVRLIPRMKEMINLRYPGTKFMIDEWSFGGEAHISGGLAIAEALGRFGKHGVDAAYYWTYPKKGTPAFEAFRAFRDYDGQGARFQDLALVTTSGDGTSIFASRDEASKKMVVVVLNTSPDERRAASIAFPGCAASFVSTYRMSGEAPFLLRVGEARSMGGVVEDVLPASSITVYELAR